MPRALSSPTAMRVAAAVAVVASLVVAGSTRLWLDNSEGPFGQQARIGALVSVGVALATGGVLLACTWWLGRRSVVALALVVAVLAAAAWVLVPARIDVSESFLPRPNERKSCTGLTFRSYPPGVMDASSVTYCVGLEGPRAPG